MDALARLRVRQMFPDSPTVGQQGTTPVISAIGGGVYVGDSTATFEGRVGRTSLTILVVALLGLAAFNLWTRNYQA